jgi:hypothetical protein
MTLKIVPEILIPQLYLIEKGCDVNKLGQTPLWLALNMIDRKEKTELVGHSIAELRSRPEIICEELVSIKTAHFYNFGFDKMAPVKRIS